MLVVIVLIFFIFSFHVNLIFFVTLIHVLLMVMVVLVAAVMLLVTFLFIVLLLFLVIFLMVLSIELVATSMRDVVLLHYQLILILCLLSEWLSTLGAVAKLLEVLIHAVSKHHLTAILSHSILSPQVPNGISIRLIDTLGNHLFPAVYPLTLPA